jgi:hypothetical protein
MINNRFAAETTWELIDSFKHTDQTSSVSSYIDTFEELMGKIRLRNPSLTEDYFVGCFVSGLKGHIKVPLRSYALVNLVQVYALAKNYEHTSQRRNTSNSYRWSSKGTTLTKNLVTEKNEKPDDKIKSTSRWEKEKCFKCQEPWVPGHNKVCKFKNQVHLISI